MPFAEEELKHFREENEQLKKRAALAEQLTNASIDCIFALDRNLCITAWNEACAQLSGLDSTQALGRSFYDVFPDARTNRHVTEAIGHALQGLKVFLPAHQVSYVTGYFESHFIPLKNADGRVDGILQVMHDVAHRVKAEQQLQDLNRRLSEQYRELKRANTELATYTHLTSHDLKEPLRKIYLFIEMVLNKDGQRLSNDGRANMRRVQSSVQRLSLMADSLVSFSEIREEQHRRTSLNHALKDALLLLKPQITDHQAVIHAQPLPDILGSEWQFRLLFQQLLSNAIKFHTPDSRPQVQIRAEYPVPIPPTLQADPAAHPSQHYLRLSVQDNGIGIEPAYHEKIFHLFAKLDHQNRYAGMGIGLALARKVVERHQGFITVSSEPGNGSEFLCYLPAKIVQES